MQTLRLQRKHYTIHQEMLHALAQMVIMEASLLQLCNASHKSSNNEADIRAL